MFEGAAVALGFLLLCFGLFAFLIGFGDWYDKRLIDCTPISRCRSVALGPVVVNGRVCGNNPVPSLIAHLPCFMSRVVVEELSDRGRNREWSVVHKRELRMPFFVEDATGTVKVEPEKAVTWLVEDVNYSADTGLLEYAPAASERAYSLPGSLDEYLREYCLTRGIDMRRPVRFREFNLSPGDPVFIYGSAAHDPRGDNTSMIIRKTLWQTPYILEGGKQDMVNKLATRGALRILAGSAAIVLASGVLARATAAERVRSAVEFVGSEISLTAEIGALFAIAFFGLLIFGGLIYNGLVSLRNEVDRAFSNVDVLLQQRFDLIPNLVSVCKAYMDHESSVMRAVSESRGQWNTARARVDKLAAAAVAMPALRQLFATAEAYPRLRANENFLQLQNSLTTIEEQIADRRELYNAAVSLYNSRIQVFPDRILASAFRFEAEPFFAAEASAEVAPSVNVTRAD